MARRYSLKRPILSRAHSESLISRRNALNGEQALESPRRRYTLAQHAIYMIYSQHHYRYFWQYPAPRISLIRGSLMSRHYRPHYKRYHISDKDIDAINLFLISCSHYYSISLSRAESIEASLRCMHAPPTTNYSQVNNTGIFSEGMIRFSLAYSPLMILRAVRVLTWFHEMAIIIIWKHIYGSRLAGWYH